MHATSTGRRRKRRAWHMEFESRRCLPAGPQLDLGRSHQRSRRRSGSSKRATLPADSGTNGRSPTCLRRRRRPSLPPANTPPQPPPHAAPDEPSGVSATTEPEVQSALTEATPTSMEAILNVQVQPPALPYLPSSRTYPLQDCRNRRLPQSHPLAQH